MNLFRLLPVSILLSGVFPAVLSAQVPALISNQGRLYDGNRMLNGTVTMVLRVYTNAVGGSYLYEDSGEVRVVDGYYFTYLGDNTTFGSLADSLAGGEAYIEVTVDGVAYPPRELIPAMAFAFRADQADSVKRGGVTGAMIAPGAVETEHLGVGAVSATKLADGAVNGRSIEDGAIGTHELADDAVTRAKLSPELRARLDPGGAAAATPAVSGVSAGSGASPFQRIQSGGDSPNLVGGHIANHAVPDTAGATVSGGGTAGEPNVAGADYTTVAGGLGNQASGRRATVTGGRRNQASGMSATISGGYSNVASASYATVGGGYGNASTGYVSSVGGGWANTAAGAVSTVGGGQDNRGDGSASTVGGGWANQAAGFAATVAGGQLNTGSGAYAAVGGGTNNLAAGDTAAIPGGANNIARGHGSFAAGTAAHAEHDGSFVWADTQPGSVTSTAPGQFLIRAGGNVGIDTEEPAEKLTVDGNVAPARPGQHSLGTAELPWSRLHVADGIEAAGNLAVVQQGRSNFVIMTSGVIYAPGTIIAGRFEGDGSGLTGVASRAISPGSITDNEMSPTAALDPAKIAGYALTQTTTFGGDVAGAHDRLVLGEGVVRSDVLAPAAVTTEKLADRSVTREKLTDDVLETLRDSASFWRVGGNEIGAGDEAYLGTRSEAPLEFRVHGVTAFRLEPSAETPNVIGGYGENAVAGGAVGAVIAGGGGTGGLNRVTGSFASIGGGLSNAAGNEYATVGGGINNAAAGSAATVAGGWRNAANDLDATVGGGQDNTAGGSAATIGGGFKNEAGGAYATVPGGSLNTAGGDYSLAAGHGAKALQDGSFVWADASGGEFASTAPNQFLIRADGNVGIDVNRPEEKLTVQGNIAPGEAGAFALGTPGKRWHSLYISSHIDFQDSLQLVSGQDSKFTVDQDGNVLAPGRITGASFVGDGSGLSGIDGNAIGAGSLYDAQISQLADIDPRKIAGIALTESARFSGDVSGSYKTLVLKDRVVDTEKLADGAVTGDKLRRGAVGMTHLDDTVKTAMNSAQTAWSRGGNTGTRANRDFIGTLDREPLELRVDGKRAFRLQPTKGSPNLVAGDARNEVSGDAVGATVSGGGSISNPNRATRNYGTVSGGVGNQANNEYTAVAGGFGNVASGFDAAIGGGQDNQAGGSGSTIGGGFTNVTSGSFSTIGGGANNQAGGNVATVAGGFGNQARGSYSTVVGGTQNLASGDYSLAGGRRARAQHAGAFVWADSRDENFQSTGNNQFLVRAAGGVGINIDRPAYPLHLGGGAYSTGSTWVNASDRALKENFEAIDDEEILRRIAEMPIQAWNYRTDDASIRHVGPTAQDFHQAFALGNNDTSISTIDASGVALAAIQALHRQNEDLREENRELRARLDAMDHRLQTLADQLP